MDVRLDLKVGARLPSLRCCERTAEQSNVASRSNVVPSCNRHDGGVKYRRMMLNIFSPRRQ
jgi:hypothetical protein